MASPRAPAPGAPSPAVAALLVTGALLAAGGLGVAPARAAAPERAGRPAHVAVVVGPIGERRFAALARAGAVGLLTPGAGDTVRGEASLAGLVRGAVPVASVDALPDGPVLIRVARRPADGPRAVTIYVALPPPGRHANTHRYPLAIVGGGYHGVLRTRSTRIDGLVSIADVAPTAVDLAEGRAPRITAAPVAAAPARLAAIDRRLDESKDASYGAALAVTAATLFLAGLAWLVRAPALARASLLVAPAAIVASLALSLAGVDRSPDLVTGIALAAPLGALALGAVLRGRLRLAAGMLAALAFVLVAMAAEPWAAGFSALGPEPGSGGRFFGVGNGMETLLLPAALLPAALLGRRWIPTVALLALGAIGLSRTGADGGGVLVLLAGFAMLALRLSGRRPGPALLGAVVVGVVAVGAAFVGIDALAGGHSHVTHAAGGGPVSLAGDLGHRLDSSAHRAVAGTGLIIASAFSIAGLTYAALLRRRSAVVDAFLVAVVVSLLVNDTPVQVLAFAVLEVAPLLAWRTVTGARRVEA